MNAGLEFEHLGNKQAVSLLCCRYLETLVMMLKKPTQAALVAGPAV
jgi:hypothetical protein